MAEFNPNISGAQPTPSGEGAKAADSAPKTGATLTHTFNVPKGGDMKLPASVTSNLGQAGPGEAEKTLDQLTAKLIDTAAKEVGERQDTSAEAERKAGGPEDIIPTAVKTDQQKDALEIAPKMAEEQQLEMEKTSESEETDDKLEDDQEEDEKKKKKDEDDEEEEEEDAQKDKKKNKKKPSAGNQPASKQKPTPKKKPKK